MTQPVSIAFVLRVWFERREIENAPPLWRGMVEHVASGERRYFDRLEEIQALLAPYLEEASRQSAVLGGDDVEQDD